MLQVTIAVAVIGLSFGFAYCGHLLTGIVLAVAYATGFVLGETSVFNYLDLL